MFIDFVCLSDPYNAILVYTSRHANVLRLKDTNNEEPSENQTSKQTKEKRIPWNGKKHTNQNTTHIHNKQTQAKRWIIQKQRNNKKQPGKTTAKKWTTMRNENDNPDKTMDNHDKTTKQPWQTTT